MHKNWRWNLHGHISMLPFTILYALACFLIYNARGWRFERGVLRCVGPKLGTLIPGTGAQCIGGAQVFADEKQIAREDLLVHENGHIVQQMICALIGLALTPAIFALAGGSPGWGAVIGSFLGTPIWGVAYGVCFFYWWAKLRMGWRPAYRANPFEQQCYEVQGRFLANLDDREKVWK